MWLKKKQKKIEYTGIDVVSDMIKEAKRKHKKVKFSCENILKKKVRLDQKFDYIFASGIFAYNKKDGNKILKKTILKMWNLSNKGVAFNCLSSKCIYKNKNEFYADPEKVLSFCKKLTPFVKIKENYLPSDFTIYLKKNK